MRRRALLLAAVVVGAGGCARTPRRGEGVAPGAPGEEPADGPTGFDAKVLEPWRDFPVDRRPRPLVLTAELPKMEGFTTGDAKIAALAGRYELAGPLPPDPPARLPVTLPDGPAQVATITAAQALDLMRAGRTPQPSGLPLKVTKVELSSAPFRTDRGLVTLPAWLFHAVDAIGPITMPAIAAGESWRPPGSDPMRPGPTGEAKIASDGTNLTVTLPAAPEPCPGDQPVRYQAVAVDSDTAVAVGLRNTTPDIRVGNCARDLMMRYAEYAVPLRRPLGNRVLLDSQGNIFMVTAGG
jgi:hypothetical protein